MGNFLDLIVPIHLLLIFVVFIGCIVQDTIAAMNLDPAAEVEVIKAPIGAGLP